VPGKVPPDKEQPIVTGMVIQGEGGPPPVVGARKWKSPLQKRKSAK
jgi:hypothetical protein